MAAHNEIGLWGEDVATEYLRAKGYIILERNWHSGHREIDIIARDGDITVFVEVKTRRNNTFTEPLDAVDYRKRRNLVLAINHYVNYRYINQWRFDVVAIIGNPWTGIPVIEHYDDIALN